MKKTKLNTTKKQYMFYLRTFMEFWASCIGNDVIIENVLDCQDFHFWENNFLKRVSTNVMYYSWIMNFIEVSSVLKTSLLKFLS